jgi:hypothetical protein
VGPRQRFSCSLLETDDGTVPAYRNRDAFALVKLLRHLADMNGGRRLSQVLMPDSGVVFLWTSSISI